MRPDSSLIFLPGLSMPLASKEAGMHSIALALVHRPEDNKVLMVRRRLGASLLTWCFPGGKIEPWGEKPADAARREVREETGVVCAKSFRKVAARKHPREPAHICYFAFTHQGGDGENIEADKHEAVAWLSPQTIIFELGASLTPKVRQELERLASDDPLRCRTAPEIPQLELI
jgi:8-oxo-dGTP pyrophosphatase MutT (NUDIX family)